MTNVRLAAAALGKTFYSIANSCSSYHVSIYR
jgi:hypothetical protein